MYIGIQIGYYQRTYLMGKIQSKSEALFWLRTLESGTVIDRVCEREIENRAAVQERGTIG